MTPANSWLILSIDAVSSVNQMTRKTLENTHFLDKDIAVLESNSIEQAKQLLQDNTEVAVVLLDNMNGSQSESLSFIRFVRDTLKNYRTRIILRTGYPDTLPELHLIENYEIDGYISKESMFATQLKIAVMTAIRAYHQIITNTAVLQALAGSIAHEMRNPLGQIKFVLDTIENKLPVPGFQSGNQAIAAKDVEECYERIASGKTAINRGLQVITMTLNQLSGKHLDPSTFEYESAARITQKTVDEYGFDTEGERQKVELKIVQDFTFKIAETPFVFILFNLIKNALYYFKSHPEARLTLTVNNGTITLRDSGPGIPPEVLPKLFGDFATSGKSEGTGLGLSYCKRTMLDFGGDITCQSVVGAFTKFTLFFPVVPPEEFEAHERQVMQDVKSIFQNKRILIVDDQPAMRQLTRQMLNDLDVELGEAENGQQALDKLQAQPFDLVVLDLNMPVLNGYETAEKIRKNKRAAWHKLPIVAYTTEAAYVAQVKTEKVGMNKFISKPCSRLALVRTLKEAMEDAAEREQAEANIAKLLAGKHVLVADDEASNRGLIMAYLAVFKITSVEAANGQEAIDILNEGLNVDAVLMDMQMSPGMDGVDATRIIRQNPAFQNLPIVALTANFADSDIQLTRDAGMNFFLSKPFSMAEFGKKLVEVFTSTPDQTPAAVAAADAPKNIAASAAFTASAHVEVAASVSPLILNSVPLLEPRRLKELERVGGPEFVAEYFQKMDELVQEIEQHTLSQNLEGLSFSLHSLMGHSGQAGAAALHDFIRKNLYITVSQHKQWPTQDGWLETVKSLFGQTQEALAGR